MKAAHRAKVSESELDSTCSFGNPVLSTLVRDKNLRNDLAHQELALALLVSGQVGFRHCSQVVHDRRGVEAKSRAVEAEPSRLWSSCDGRLDFPPIGVLRLLSSSFLLLILFFLFSCLALQSAFISLLPECHWRFLRTTLLLVRQSPGLIFSLTHSLCVEAAEVIEKVL